MTTDEKNRYVCEKLGICWHEKYIRVPFLSTLPMQVLAICEKCGKEESDADRPDFSTDAGAVQLLREMMSHPDWTYAKDWLNFVDTSYITTPGKLLDAVVGWLGREK